MAVHILSNNGKLVRRSDLDTAVNSPDAVGKTIIVTGTESITASMEIPSGVAVKCENGGILDIATGVTVEFLAGSTFSCGLFQCFSCTGTGSVAFSTGSCSEILSEWFGSTTDAAQLAINASQYIPTNINLAHHTWTKSLYVQTTDKHVRFREKAILDNDINYPFIALGQNAAGALVSVYNVTVEDLYCVVADTPQYASGSAGIVFNGAASCFIIRPKLWQFESGLTTIGGYAKNICCSIHDPDLRYNHYGLYDSTGGLKGSTVYGGRIEANTKNGVYFRTGEFNMVGVTIEGNGSGNSSEADDTNINYGGAKLALTDCYFEDVGATNAISHIYCPVNYTLVSIVGCSFRTNSPYLAHVIHATEDTGEFTILGGLIKNIDTSVFKLDTAASSTKVYAAVNGLDYSLPDPTLNLNNATYYIIDMERAKVKTNTYLTSKFQNIAPDTGFGIDFSANSDSSRTVTSNVLTDYEYGTWTPALTFATPGDLSIAYATQLGSYIKVGNMVTLTGYIITSTFTHSTASGNLRITAIPDFGSPALNSFGAGHFGGITKANYTNYAVEAYSSSYFYVAASGSGQAPAYVTKSDTPTGGTVRVAFTVSYPVA